MLEIIVLLVSLATNPLYVDYATTGDTNQKGPVISGPADTVTPQKPPKMN